MKSFSLFYKEVGGNEGNKCHYTTRLDTYGCGCQHDCKYCYAKSLLEFRNLWNSEKPVVGNMKQIKNAIINIKKKGIKIVRLGGMTDCFQPLELKYRTTYQTIRLLNKYKIGYLIVTKSHLVANEEYLKIYDKELANGNGALMRMLPIIFYLDRIDADEETIYDIVKNVTQLTHAHNFNLVGTYIFVRYCLFLLKGYDKRESYDKIKELDYSMFTKKALKKYDKILNKDLETLKESSIRSGISIWETLEAVLWSVLTNNNFKDTLLTALNLGEDTDTVGAITGGVAGILYQREIPREWEKKLKGIKYIKKITNEFEKTINKIKRH